MLLAFGPSYLYFSRFAREDIYFAAITLALLVVAFRFLDRPRRHQPALIGALLAASFATKETTFITVLRGRHVLRGACWSRRGGGMRDRRRSRARRPARRGAGRWRAVPRRLHAALHDVPHPPDGRATASTRASTTGSASTSVGRGGEPWSFYVVVLFGVEWPVLLLGAIGAVVALRRPTLLRVFLIWAFVVSLVVYSWAGEKFAWLVLHPLLPLILLAGVGVQAIWDARGALVRASSASAVDGRWRSPTSVFASCLVNAVHRADPRELLVSTQSSEDVKRVADEVVGAGEGADHGGLRSRSTPPRARRSRGRGTSATSTSATSTSARPARAAGRRRADPHPGRARPPRPALQRLRGRAVPVPRLVGARLRRDVAGDWWRWLTKREAWNPTGGMPEWLYEQRWLEAARSSCRRGRTRARPSASHLASPASPYVVRSIGPTTT